MDLPVIQDTVLLSTGVNQVVDHFSAFWLRSSARGCLKQSSDSDTLTFECWLCLLVNFGR